MPQFFGDYSVKILHKDPNITEGGGGGSYQTNFCQNPLIKAVTPKCLWLWLVLISVLTLDSFCFSSLACQWKDAFVGSMVQCIRKIQSSVLLPELSSREKTWCIKDAQPHPAVPIGPVIARSAANSLVSCCENWASLSLCGLKLFRKVWKLSLYRWPRTISDRVAVFALSRGSSAVTPCTGCWTNASRRISAANCFSL